MRSPSVRAVMKRYGLMLFLLVGAASLRADQEFTANRGWLHVNGYSHHLAAPDANDALLGFGFTYYRRGYGRFLPAWEGDVFQDSARKPSVYLGHSWTMPTRRVSFGVTAALMYHRNFAAYHSAGIMPVAFPFLETRGSRVKARVYYIPPIRKASDQQIAVQIMAPLFR